MNLTISLPSCFGKSLSFTLFNAIYPQFENMSSKKSTNSELIINRFKEGLGLKTDKSLCEYLDIRQTTLSGWKTRNSFDYDLMFSKRGLISIHWLVTGEGPMFFEATKSPKGISELSEWKEKCLEILEENRQLRKENDALKAKKVK